MKNVLKKIVAVTLSLALVLGTVTTGYAEAKEKNYIYLDNITERLTVAYRLVSGDGVKVAVPANLSAGVDGSNVMNIGWTAVDGAKNYVVYKASKSDGKYTKLGITDINAITDKEVTTGKSYYYKVRALGGVLGHISSPVSQAVVGYTKFAAPTGVSSSFDSSTNQINISWKAVDGASKYYIYKKRWSGEFTKVATAGGTSQGIPVTWNGTYTYKVAAVNAANSKDDVGLMSSETSINVTSIPEVPGNRKKIALTFDDGPGPYTKAIVDCLNGNNSKATFFVVGNRVASYSGVLSYAYQSGHEIANHSYSHPMLTGLDAAGIQEQVSNTDAAISNVIGVNTVLMRPPGGAVNQNVKDNVGKPMINWSIDTLDWKTRNKTATINSVMNNVREGDIILMHDIHRPTMEAVLELVPLLRSEGYEMVTVSELARLKGYNLSNGVLYTSLR